jgi:predicted NBD/HSP70 family sugar kinase
MRESDGSLTSLRQYNRRQVLKALRSRGTSSRAEIAKLTGLSTTTISSLVADLLSETVIVELPDRANSAGGSGRPARMLAFNPAAGGAVGVHMAHDHVRVGLTDLAGEVIARETIGLDVDHEPAQTLDFVAHTTLELIARASLDRSAIVGLGVAVSAPVSVSTRAIDADRILPDWRGTDIATELGTRTGIRVEVGNDANLGAIAEHRLGVARHSDDFVYVMLSDGVGAGLVLGGRLYQGAIGGAGELGHVTVVSDGFICRCGNRGCLETVAGAPAIVAAMGQVRGAGTTLPAVIESAARGDHGARRVLADAGRAVGRALLPVCTVLDPSLVVIGGECAASAALLDAAREELARGMTPLRSSAIPVLGGALGDEAEMLGALTLARQRMTLR